MIKRVLKRSNIEVSAMGFGCWAIGGEWGGDQPQGWGKVDDDESIQAIHQVLNLGLTFFDTADVYGTGHSEHLLGRALDNRRQHVVIATRFGVTFDEVTKTPIGLDASTAYIRQACETSLKRINTDYIDLYQFLINDYDPDLAGEVYDTLERLVN